MMGRIEFGTWNAEIGKLNCILKSEFVIPNFDGPVAQLG